MFHYLNSVLVTHFHDTAISQQDMASTADADNDVWDWIEINHMYNCKLWNEEDRARRIDVPSDEIARSKRLIDGYNQARSDAVEMIDEKLLDELRDRVAQSGARLNSETPGSMLDRLSILSLKIHHMHRQTQRDDVKQEHRDICATKVRRLMEQRRDLADCFDRLLRELADGTAYFKVYRQFKMYNDPRLNSWLHPQRGGRQRAGASPHERQHG